MHTHPHTTSHTHTHYTGDSLDGYGPWVLVIFFISLLFGFCFVGGLFMQHTYLILANETTHERLRPPNYALDLAKGPKNPFNAGFRRNWASVMGEKPRIWLLPINPRATLEGDGYTFPLNPKMIANSAAATVAVPASRSVAQPGASPPPPHPHASVVDEADVAVSIDETGDGDATPSRKGEQEKDGGGESMV